MTPDRDDPILDSCLEEVLGGRRPPNLTDRILRALAEARIDQKLPTPAYHDPVIDVSIDPHPIAAVNGQRVGYGKSRRRASPLWQWAAVSAVVGGLGIALGIAALNFADPQLGGGDPVVVWNEQKPGPKGNQRQVAGAQNQKPSPEAPRVAQDGNRGSTVIPLDVQGADNDPQPPMPADRPSYVVQPLPDEELLSQVNAELHGSWEAAQVNPADPAQDSEWCQRLFARVLGRQPNQQELAAFVADKSANKRQRLVDRLLGSEYSEQFAQHWASVWTNVLVGRTGGAEGSQASREGLHAYLRASLAENKPYSKLVTELLTATGANRPGAPQFNGAVNFLLAGLNDNATLATSRVSRVFLGQQLHCAECHNHPSQKWSQHQYWALNSFLRQTDVQREGDVVRLVAADFVNKDRVTKDGEVYYQESPTRLVKAAEPEFIDGTKIPSSGKLAVVDRRQELAKLVVNSREMPRALVNRLWSHFFGYGFTNPIDDMGPHSEPSHPELLDTLAGQFVAHDYDLKRAIRWMVLSDAFGRSSQIPGGGLADMPESGKTPPLFSRYYGRPLNAEEVRTSLLTASKLRKEAGIGGVVQARRDFLFQLDRGGSDAQSAEAGNMQSEYLLNSRLNRRVVSAQDDNRLKTLAGKDSLTLEQKIEHLFFAALSRKPTAGEQQAIAQILATAGNNQGAALEDIWWALINSNELVLDQ